MGELLGLDGEAHQVEQLARFVPPGPGGVATHAEPEGHVVDGVHVGKERVALEDHAHVALLGRSACQVLAVDEHVTGVEGLEASEHPKSRRLPATRGAEERHQLARSDVEAEAVERLGGPEGAAKARQTHRRTRPLGRQWSLQSAFARFPSTFTSTPSEAIAAIGVGRTM